MWVLLKSKKCLEIQGKPRTFCAGDWVDVGKQTALRWIAEGDAWIPEGKAVDLLSADCGVFAFGGGKIDEGLGDYAGKIEVQCGDFPAMPWTKTMVWDPALRLRRELVPIGFHLLDTWQAAIPLFDYEKLASTQGSETDRERTKAVIRDLRVPLYCARLLFLKRCGDTERLLERWREEHEEGDDLRYSLLRAIYAVKPLLLALPTTWIWKDMGAL